MCVSNGTWIEYIYISVYIYFLCVSLKRKRKWNKKKKWKNQRNEEMRRRKFTDDWFSPFYLEQKKRNNINQNPLFLVSLSLSISCHPLFMVWIKNAWHVLILSLTCLILPLFHSVSSLPQKMMSESREGLKGLLFISVSLFLSLSLFVAWWNENE